MESILSFLQTRPAFKLAILFIIGLIAGNYLNISPSVLFFILFALFIVTIVSLCVKVSLLNFVFIIAVIFAGILRYELATQVFPPKHIINFLDTNKSLTIVGKVVGFPHQRKNRIEVEVKVKELISQTEPISTCGKILVRLWRLTLLPDYGDQLQITGNIQQPRGERNPGDFNYKKFLAANGIYGILNVSKSENVVIRPSNQKSIPYFVYVIKRRFYHSLNSLHQGQAQALIKGLLLGERGEISLELKEAFARCGVIHALAISGLHIGYIGIIFFVLFSLLRFNYQARLIAVLISIFFYDLLIGFEPPIVRASLMMGIFLIGKLIQRPTDMLNVISTAAIIILLVNPQELFQASFQLSFGAIISIVYLYQRLRIIFDKWSVFNKLTQNKIGEYLGALFLVTLAAQLGTLPITAYYFGRISIIAFALNLLVIPLVGIVIALGFATLIFSLISMPVAQLYANTNSIFLQFLIRIVENGSDIKFTSFDISKIGLVTILIYYFMLWCIINLDKKFYRKILLYSVLTISILSLWKPIFRSHRWMQVIFFDVGQGDAALITFPDGKNLLIDAGPKLEDFDAGEFFILPYLKRERINRLNAVVLSHADNDHIGGMPSIFRKLRVDKVYDSGLFHESSVCSTYQFVIDSLQIPHHIALASQRLKYFENYGVYIIHPAKSFLNKFHDDTNNCSVVVKIVYGERSFLFSGDIAREAEEILLKYGELLRADVLKIAHHGSRTSSIMEWLKLVRPQYAVISVGRNNRFNFPAPSVLKRLKQLRIETIRTDLNGAVVFRTDGNRLERIR